MYVWRTQSIRVNNEIVSACMANSRTQSIRVNNEIVSVCIASGQRRLDARHTL